MLWRSRSRLRCSPVGPGATVGFDGRDPARSGRTPHQNAYQIAATRDPPFALLRLSGPVKLSS
jgi:hypothetical protein